MQKFNSLLAALFFVWQTVFSQQLPDKKVNFLAKDITIEQALEQLTVSEGINFSYQSNLRSFQRRITLAMSEQPLSQVLSAMLRNSGLAYKIFANQVVIQSATLANKRIFLEGRICPTGSYDPVPYAGVELKLSRRGTVADHDGRFRFEIEEKNLQDTLRISSLNYNLYLIPARNLAEKGLHTIFLTPKVYSLPPLEIRSNVGSVEEIGNRKWFRRGSLYIDTHGQQTALFIDNEKEVSVRIMRVSYYLSAKGNTNAPFRVRIYECDSITKKPGEDLLPEIVVVKPNQGKGWFTVNVSKYNLKVPKKGFFVAMEGVFPDDYDYYYEGTEFKSKPDNSESDNEDFTDADLQYGQQLGYTHASTNNTWHYAIDKTWFQLKKGHFNVLISAGIWVKKDKKKWKIFKIFQKHENDSIDHKPIMVE